MFIFKYGGDLWVMYFFCYNFNYQCLLFKGFMGERDNGFDYIVNEMNFFNWFLEMGQCFFLVL